MTLPSEFVIRGGRVVDGSGRAAFAADVIVTDGRIRLAEAGEASGFESVEVDGLVVSPGFIDTHAHADVEPYLEDEQVHAARIVQGVTTEIVGNCGFSPFPVPAGRDEVLGSFLSVVFGPQASTFEEFDGYREGVEAKGLASNVAPLVGHGTLRAGTLGYENRHATPAEIELMRERLERALTAGAFGMSTGLCYTPATYAPPAEVQALAEVVARVGGIYSTHIRNETDLTADSLEEAFQISRATGVPVHISHLKVAGGRHWGTSGEIIAQLEAARAEGVDVTADVYPYTAASTSLHSLLPPWTAQEGIDRLFENLGDEDWRQRVTHDLENGVPGWQNLGTAAGWHNVTIATSVRRPEWEGKAVADLMEPDERPIDAIARVLDTNRGKVVVVIEAMDADDVTAFLTWDHSVVGSDGIPLPGRPHPRLTGTFPRVLRRYRDALGSLEAAVNRMTGASAQRFQIPDRGFVADGLVADLVVLDPDAVSDRSTYAEPWLRPEGIHHVIVGGKPAVWDSELVDGRTGVVLRRGQA